MFAVGINTRINTNRCQNTEKAVVLVFLCYHSTKCTEVTVLLEMKQAAYSYKSCSPTLLDEK